MEQICCQLDNYFKIFTLHLFPASVGRNYIPKFDLQDLSWCLHLSVEGSQCEQTKGLKIDIMLILLSEPLLFP